MEKPRKPIAVELAPRHSRGLSQALATLGVRLESSLLMLSTISCLTDVQLRAKGMEQAGELILEVLVLELTDIAACSILLFEDSRQRLELLAALGADDLTARPGAHNKRLGFSPGQGIAGRVFEAREPCFWDEDSPQTEFLLNSPELTRPRSLACLPLLAGGEPLGVLNISFTQVRPFDFPRQRDLIVLSQVVANILHSQRLSQAAQPGASPVLEALLEGCLDLVMGLSPAGRLMAANRAWRRTLGFMDSDLARLELGDILTGPSAAQALAAFERARQGSPASQVTAELKTREHQAIAVMGGFRPSFSRGALAGVIGLFQVLSS